MAGRRTREVSAPPPSVRPMPTRSTGRAPRATYRCSECGWETVKWVGRCGECQAWGTVVEKAAPQSRVQAGPVTAPARPIGEVPIEDSHARASGVPELDRVLGGGLVPGAAILLAGEPGVGKSTLLLEVAAQTAAQGDRVLYVTGEESAAQVRMRADRTGGIHDELYLAAETDLGAVLGHIEAVKPTLLVIDSVQTISAGDVDGVPGRGHAGQGGLGGPDPDGQAAQHHPGDHRPRHQGRHHRRPARARAPRRRRAAVRGRAHLAAADGACGEEPLRPRRRGRLLRPLRRGHRRDHRPHRPVPRHPPRPGARHLRGGHHGGSSPPPERGAGAGHPHLGRAPPAYDVRGGLRPASR